MECLLLYIAGKSGKKHGIGGKIGRWIMEFLKERKIRIVTISCISRKEDVILGVPQGCNTICYNVIRYR